MRQLLKNILLFAIFVFGPICVLHFVVKEGMKKSPLAGGSLNDIYNSRINADLLIAGSSRAINHYDTRVLDSMLHLNSYNIGISGWGMNLEYAMYKLYVAHNKKPRYVVQNIGWSHFRNRHDFFGYEQFIPYAGDSIVQAYTGGLEGSFTFADRYFPLFCYNNHFRYIWEGFKSYCFNVASPPPYPSFKGFIPLHEKWMDNVEFENLKKNAPEVFQFDKNDTLIRDLRLFLQDCKDHDIKAILVYSPTYIETTYMMHNRAEMLRIYNEIADEYNVPILDYTFDSISHRKELFANTQHMNAEGARLFSQRLATDLVKFISP